jgi:ATP-dependent helicase HrpB
LSAANEPFPSLPVDAVRDEFLARLASGPVVLTAPTGSGKSTQAPRWCAADGPVLVIEPRRVACRGLASRVAELEGSPLGQAVGYAVRDDSRMTPDTAIVFATPGIVLRWLAEGPLHRYATVLVDEFHERSLDVDLLLALLQARYDGRVGVMSATLEGERVASHLGGCHLQAEGRRFPVQVRYRSGQAFLPDARGLEERVADAVRVACDDPGDILVFLPGKAEIGRAADALRTVRELDVLPIHGGLSLEEQARVFQPGPRRRVILATNVAETSITIPGIGVVIDSGLVRRTRYHNGRGFLTLAPIAVDSAEQRSGRAGRTAPGICYRLWSREALLTERTPPEIHRESLVPLVMSAAACGAAVRDLPFLDPPKAFAVDAAEETLARLGALADGGALTARGRQLFHLPLDPPLAALLVEAERHDAIDDMIDLVAALSVGRPLFAHGPRPGEEELDLRRSGCDAVACIRAVREGDPQRHGLNRFPLQEARLARKRLRALFQRPGKGPSEGLPDRRLLARAALAADPACAHVPRRRKRGVAWANGGTEVSLGRDSAVDEEKAPHLLVLESQALGIGARKTSVVITCAMPVPVQWLVEEGVGEDQVLGATIERGAAMARIGRVYAGATLQETETLPVGRLARESIGRLFLDGRLLPDTRREAEERLEARRLFLRLLRAGLVDPPHDVPPDGCDGDASVPNLSTFTATRLVDIGVESGRDMALLNPGDLLPDDLPKTTREWLDRRFPRTLDLGDGQYRVSYDLGRRQVTLEKTDGQRKLPPPLQMLPAWRGFSILVRHTSKAWQLR